MRSRRHTEELGESGIDLAPMLDFVLNLLIFFIITTSFVKEAGITVDRPFAETALTEETGNLLIAINAGGEVWMDRRRVDIREVRQIVERFHVERPDDTVVVVADQKAKSSLVGQVMDEVQQGGIKRVAIAAASPEGSGS